MPLTATVDNIKAYLEKVEKNEITPEALPDCAVCGLDACHFKLHAFRERRFLIIVDIQVQPQYAPLVRFRCPGCNKTVCFYPDFALPHKHYTRQSIMAFAERYVADVVPTHLSAFIDCHSRYIVEAWATWGRPLDYCFTTWEHSLNH